VSEDPTTQELRLDVLQRELKERERAEQSTDPDDTGQHMARADKASYLREKLEQRAEAERRAAADDETP
jgi:beta-lactamase class A